MLFIQPVIEEFEVPSSPTYLLFNGLDHLLIGSFCGSEIMFDYLVEAEHLIEFALSIPIGGYRLDHISKRKRGSPITEMRVESFVSLVNFFT